MAYSVTYRHRLVPAYTDSRPAAVQLEFEITGVTDFADSGLLVVEAAGSAIKFRNVATPADLEELPVAPPPTGTTRYRTSSVSIVFDGVYGTTVRTDWCSVSFTPCSAMAERRIGADDMLDSITSTLQRLVSEMNGLSAGSAYTTGTIS